MQRYILYLEPSKTSVLYSKLVSFFSTSKAIFGPNEAHQYHPHCSLTGFFLAPPELEGSMVRAVAESISKIAESNATVTLKSIESIMTSKPLMTGKTVSIQTFPSVKLQLTCDAWNSILKDLLRVFREEMEIEIRPKEATHISLAYNHHYTIPIGKKAGLRNSISYNHVERHQLVIPTMAIQKRKTFSHNTLSSDEKVSSPKVSSPIHVSSDGCESHLPLPVDIQGNMSLARTLLDLDKCKEQVSMFDIALYELTNESFELDVPHEFRVVHRWENILNTAIRDAEK